MFKKIPLLVIIFLMVSSQIFAQAVRGKVISSADGQPLPGVSVVVKGTNAGTATNADGTYTINVSPKSQLIFSYIGFTSLTVDVNSRSVVDVSMTEDMSSLGELVVTGFGISREQKALGYATSTIAAKDLTNVANTNVANALYGKAAGVRIAAAPGGSTSATNIVIRGVNSITGRSQPLIVMDGIPIRDGEVRNNDYWSDQRQRGNALNEINPEDIESISILKGASAAALYGSEAVNGVVMITTKKGAKGKKGFNVDFNANTSVDRVAYTP
jgi:TonB-dependent SusC/RagA subfamily outer membrane receptor